MRRDMSMGMREGNTSIDKIRVELEGQYHRKKKMHACVHSNSASPYSYIML